MEDMNMYVKFVGMLLHNLSLVEIRGILLCLEINWCLIK